MSQEEHPIQLADLPEDALAALTFLRGHLSGTIRFDGDYVPIKVVIAPDGRLVAPVMVAMIRSVDCALFLPGEPSDENDKAIQLQVDLEEFQEDGPQGGLADRWRIYHGDPPDVNWASFSIDAGKMQHLFVSGEALQVPNALAPDEAAICREVNQGDTEQLLKAAAEASGITLDSARLVGVDQLGFDVRGRFDVVRIDSNRILHDADDARTCINAIMEANA